MSAIGRRIFPRYNTMVLWETHGGTLHGLPDPVGGLNEGGWDAMFHPPAQAAGRRCVIVAQVVFRVQPCLRISFA